MISDASSPHGQRLSVRIRTNAARERGSTFTLDVEFTAAPGFTILFGPSGAGKTTLLDCIAGLQAPAQGRIAVGDVVLFDSESAIDIQPSRRNVYRIP